jgi:hypothetical protein
MADALRESATSRPKVTSEVTKKALRRILDFTALNCPCALCGKPNSLTEAAYALGYWCGECCTGS